MKPQFSKRDKFIVGIGTLLLVLLVTYGQFFLLTPLKSEIGIKQQSLEAEKKLLDIVSQKKVATAQNTIENTSALQKRIPVQPLQEQFILDLEKAENVSDSTITSMGFSRDVDAATVDEQTKRQITNTGENTTDQNATNQSTEKNKQSGPTVPPGLKKLTVQLSVESPTYEDLEKFIETLESLPRIVVVESINYSGGKEVTSLDQKDEPISFTLTVSAFYMSSLTDLQAEVPKIDAPAPAGKDNPLSQFSATTPTQP